MSGSARGGNNHRNHQRFGRKDDPRYQRQQDQRSRDKTPGEIFTDGRLFKNRQNTYDRPVWTAPITPTDPVPAHNCPWCGKPISDISTAINDKATGEPIHFDCVLARLNETETLETNDAVCYIGGGRFGIVHYNDPPNTIGFKIKRIFEWENKDNRGEWRRIIGERFSVT